MNALKVVSSDLSDVLAAHDHTTNTPMIDVWLSIAMFVTFLIYGIVFIVKDKDPGAAVVCVFAGIAGVFLYNFMISLLPEPENEYVEKLEQATVHDK